jgi:protein-tyrosine phosphatase
MIDASRIGPKLYQGSLPPTGSRLRTAGFDVLVLCAKEFQPAAFHFPGVEVVHCPLWDGEASMSELVAAREGARRAAEAHRQGRRVLVTCRQGRNRSGLVVAMTIRMLTGASGKRIVHHIRKRRSLALTNTAFARALGALP